MYLSSLIGLLIAEMAKHGDIPVLMEGGGYKNVAVRGFYVYCDDEFGTRELVIEPMDH